ncbi:MAG: formylglycine-generating enzyme family protein [bacterium]|nr:formylglycine-generating enzyme family protein [bacterium]
MTTTRPFRLLLLVAAFLLLSPAAHALTVDWVTVGGAFNYCDLQPQGCFGAVGYEYRISKYETTNAQYTEFLNAVARTDSNGLFNTNMGKAWPSGHGGIARSGSPGSYTYNAIPGHENKPVISVSFYDSLRFANWLNNGAGSGDTESGAYTITSLGISGNSITRNALAKVFIPSEDEWYKAAYYDVASTSYFDNPMGSNVIVTCDPPRATPNRANCFVGGLNTPAEVGGYTGSASPNGTFDQGGNVWEWNEAIVGGSSRGLRGGGFYSYPWMLTGSERHSRTGASEGGNRGFRIARTVAPEPSPALLGMMGLLVLTIARRNR